MRITPFLRYQPFWPEQIEAMAAAFDDACAALEITDRTDDPATEIVAGASSNLRDAAFGLGRTFVRAR